jgi:hypothetical protein
VNAFAVFFLGWGFADCAGAISGVGGGAVGVAICGADAGLPKSARRISSSVNSVFMGFLVGDVLLA